MDEATLKLVKHHVRPDAWNGWEQFFPDAAARLDAEATAFAVEGTAAGVAAYILETLADSATRTAATDPQVRRMKDGAEEIEYFERPSVSAADAAIYAARATALRGGGRAANPAPVLDAWGLV